MHLLTAARDVSREAVTLVPSARPAGASYGGHVMPDVTSTTDYVIKCVCVWCGVVCQCHGVCGVMCQCVRVCVWCDVSVCVCVCVCV